MRSTVSEPIYIAPPESASVGEPQQNGSNRAFYLSLAAVIVVAALMYATFSVAWVKFSRAEVFFSECAREMIAQNNMVTPLYHAQPFFDKPIWSYWLIIAMFKTLGVSHWAARVPSIIASLGTIALTAFGTRWVGTKCGASTEQAQNAGLLAAMLLASSFMFFSFSYLCMSDMTLVFCDTITLVLAYLGIVKPERRTRLWALASVSMGFAFITKGPVGIVLPAIATLGYLAITRQLRAVRPLHIILGAVIATVIALPWFFAAYKANGSWALAYFFIRENLIRYAGAMYDTHKPVWFMVQSLALGFCPWTPLIPFALWKQVPQIKNRQVANDPRLFAWLWTAVLIGFFSFSRGKCDYYALPVYPAVASMVALYLATSASDKLRRWSATGLSITAIVVGALSPLLMSRLVEGSQFSQWWILPTALVLTGAAGLITAANNRVIASFSTLFVGLCISLAGFAAQAFPVVMSAQSIDVYANTVKHSPAPVRLAVAGSLHHWVDELTFQSERETTELADSGAIEKWFAAGPAMALLPEETYHEALAQQPALAQMDLKILDRRRVAVHALTPGYVMKRGGNIFDSTLLLISN